MTKEEADEIIEAIDKLKKDIRDFKAKNGWHYVSEEGFPKKVDEYYFIATQSQLGIHGNYCKLVRKSVPGIPFFDEKGCLVKMSMDGSFVTKEWYHPDSAIMNWLNEPGHVYAWMPLPALPEVKW